MRRILLFLVLFPFSSSAQEYDFTGEWVFLGPDDKPSSISKMNTAGVGPVEFIRVSHEDPRYLLAGSLSGGLFFSTDSGENWQNSGSDYWPYPGCGWADFYPTDHNTWFAYSNSSDNNGKPGKIGDEGGVYRTTGSHTDWELIFSSANLSSPLLAIYGTRFNPADPKQLFVMTEEGLYYTDNCLAASVNWYIVTGTEGWIYDLDFIGDRAFVSHFQFGKWSVKSFTVSTLSSVETIAVVSDIKEELRTITFEPHGENLLVLVDFKEGADAIYEYTIEKNELKKLVGNRQVNYGSGHTFAVSPHNKDEFLVGYSTTLKKWNYSTLKETRIGSGFHVDVEFVAYDPVDTSKIYLACHGGVYISYDKGASWQNKSKGLGVAEVMGMDVSETDPDEIVIGTFHDGSSVRADFNKDGNYFWRAVNGGDALTPLIDPANAAVIYTSTQFTGGGLYYSKDTAAKFVNIHTGNGLKTSGWELSAVLHPIKPSLLYFNFTRNDEEGKGNIDIARTPHAATKKMAVTISDFGKTHNMQSYKVYGIFNSVFFPEHLYAYVLHYDKGIDGNPVINHRLFRTTISSDSAAAVIESWYELDVPLNAWIGDVECDPENPDLVYVSYAAGADGDAGGLIYALTYHPKKHRLKRALDITQNLPETIAGRFNMICRSENGTEIFIATRTGAWYGDAATLSGQKDWLPVGSGLPHCKVFGLHYHEGERMLTVGLFGRGVWRYYF